MPASEQKPFCLADYEPFIRTLNESGLQGVLIWMKALTRLSQAPGWWCEMACPCSLFICKLHAANTRPAELVSNDVMHLRILARVVPRFLARIRATALPEYDAREDAARLRRQIEACGSGRHEFRVPLEPAELEPLVRALREHLGEG